MADTESKPDTDEAPESGEDRFSSEIETVGPCKIDVKITIPEETIQTAFDERYEEIIKTVSFPGFRVGHAPRRLVEKKLGDEVRSDVKEGLILDSFKEAVDKHDIDPIHEPDVDMEAIEFDPDRPTEYTVTLLVRPTVEVPDFEKITVQAAKVEVTDEKVDEVIEDLRKQNAVLEAAPDGKMAEDDTAILDVNAVAGDEKVIERENAEYHHPADFVVGLRVPGLKDAILGKSAGDEFTITETLPETWPNPDLAGKEMTVAVTVHDVKRNVLPELNDEFAEILDYDSVEELREEVQVQVERHAEQEAKDQTDRRIVDALIEAADFELPEDVVKQEITTRIDRKMAILRMQGADEEKVEADLAEARSDERAEVEREFRSGFLLAEIARAEKVFVTESEVEERVARMASGYNRSEDEMKEYLEQRDMMGTIRSSMREEKVMEILRKKIKIEEQA